MKNSHIPVLLQEVSTAVLQNHKNPTVFDGTFGGGGYSKCFVENGCMVHACDLDEEALIVFSHENLKKIHSNFSYAITQFDDDFFDAVVLDLGFSSNQLDFSGRGFSYQQKDEILDLRYDKNAGKSTLELLKNIDSTDTLGKIIYTFSGESLSKRIAQNIIDMLKTTPSPVVVDFLSAIDSAIPKKLFHKRNAIYSRVWQSLRIWTNHEFDHLNLFLDSAVKKLKPNGILAIVCFHSLEDKIVTKFMRNMSKPIEIDDFGNKIQLYSMITKKPITPTENEVEINKRSRSATLRILKRIQNPD
jgi:16S rRNA (cytosine1402-N4)-methyltransferase